MKKVDENFVNNLIAKTPEQIEQARKDRNKELYLQNLKNYHEATKPLKVLTEDLKKATDRFFKSTPNPSKNVLEVEVIPQEPLMEQIRVDGPLSIKNDTITIDKNKLAEMIAEQASQIAQTALDKLNLKNMEALNVPGGGAVGIKYKTYEGQRQKIARSVNDIVFTGDGVTVTREGKNVLVNIPGASVVAGDPTIDFARESTVLDMLTTLDTMYNSILDIQQMTIPESYNTIGGLGTPWSPTTLNIV